MIVGLILFTEHFKLSVKSRVTSSGDLYSLGGTPPGEASIRFTGLYGDMRPDRVWFLGFFVLNGVYISPLFVLKGVSLHGPMSDRIGLYARRGVTSQIFTNVSVLLTYVDFGMDTYDHINLRSHQSQ